MDEHKNPDLSESYEPAPDAPRMPRTEPLPVYIMNAAAPQKKRRFWSFLWTTIKILFFILIIGALFSKMANIEPIEETPYAGENPHQKIALIDIDSIITMELPSLVRDKFRRAEKDNAVKGIILVVNSPGGSVVPSEMIHQYIANCSKPVYACIEQLGASGAYWIAVASDKIYAQTNSVVGSIGVIYTSFVLEDALKQKLGIDPVVLKARKADAKDRGSIFRQPTEEETSEILNDLDTIHQRFVDVVSQDRSIASDTLWPLANGEVFDGPESLAHGLIDRIGFLDDAIADMTAELMLTNPVVVRYTRIPTIRDYLRAGALRIGLTEFAFDRRLEELRQWTGIQALWQGN